MLISGRGIEGERAQDAGTKSWREYVRAEWKFDKAGRDADGGWMEQTGERT